MSNARNQRNTREVARFADPFDLMRDFHHDINRRFGFGSLFADDFFRDDFDPFSRQVGHSFGHMGHFGQGMEPRGNYVCQSYTSSTVIGPDGKPVTEKTVRNETGKVGSDGRQIREANEMYDHSGKNVQRVTKERGLGDKKVVVTREIKDQQREEHRNLVNVEEEELETFNRQWSDVAQREQLGHVRYVAAAPSRSQLRLRNERHN